MQHNQPFLKDEFAIRWSALEPAHIVPDMRAAIEQGKQLLQQIENLPSGSESFENTFATLHCAVQTVSLPWDKVSVLESTCDSPALREARSTVLAEVSDFFAAIPLNPVLYARLRAYAEQPGRHPRTAIEERMMREALKDFEDSGADRDTATRERLQAIEASLAQLTKDFSENVLDTLNSYEKIVTDPQQLSGLPDSHIEAARQSALKKGYGSEQNPQYRFTLQAPSYVPVMRYADCEALRKELTEAYLRVGHSDDKENEPLIRSILQLRREKAHLLGCKDFADWVLARRMAKNGDRALAFVEDLHAKTHPAFVAENDELIAYKARCTGSAPAPMAPWDFSYWSEKLRRERYDFDEEALRPYFPVDSVMQGMFRITQQIFGIDVREEPAGSMEVWHPEVRCYRVEDSASGRHLGSFYADWFPRETKRSGAWMGSIRYGEAPADQLPTPHLGYICGNMNPPLDGQPALLSHSDVLTIFHEFGHLLHMVLSEVPLADLGGTNVAWDFVELPSQILENWCWDREGLDCFARHHLTGETIPDQLFAKMIAARNYGEARAQMRQLAFGKMDLELHRAFDPADESPSLDDYIETVLADYLPPRSVKLPSGIRSFGHLFSDATGYAAGYYSYKWAEVLDADAFTRFQQEGILNPRTGREFRQHILAMGNAEEPELLFHRFMGRDPDPDALLRRAGLLTTPATV